MGNWKTKKWESKQAIFVKALIEKYNITEEEAESVVHGIDKWMWDGQKDKKGSA